MPTRRRTARRDRAGDRRPRWHRRGVPGAAADCRDRGRLAARGVRPGGSGAAACRRGGAVRCGRRGEGDHAGTCEAPATLPAYGDRELIQQAVANLVDNAVKFSPPGSAVRLSASATPAGLRSRWPTRDPASRRRPRARRGAVLPRRDRAQHARLRAGARAGAGGGAIAWRQPALDRCGAGAGRHSVVAEPRRGGAGWLTCCHAGTTGL